MNLKKKIIQKIGQSQGMPILKLDEEQKLVPIQQSMSTLQMGTTPQLPQIDNPLQMIDGLKEQVAGLRDTAIQKFGEQTDLQKAATGIADETYQNVARTTADMVLPDVSDAATGGFGRIQKLNKLRKFGKEGAAVQNIIKDAGNLKDEAKLFELHHTRPGAGLEGKAVFDKSSELGAVYDPKMNILNGENLLKKPVDITNPQRFGKVLDPKMNVLNGKNLLNPAQKTPVTKVTFNQVSGAEVTKRLRDGADDLRAAKLRFKGEAKSPQELSKMYDSHKQAVIAKIKQDIADGK